MKTEEILSNQIPSDIPTGDMPGETVKIAPGHIDKAKTIFPRLLALIRSEQKDAPGKKLTVSVSGGSGAGKSGVASVLSYMLNEEGLGSFVISGDNYPRRIPSANDNERLHIFRLGGIRGLRDAGMLTPDIVASLRKLQCDEKDADTSLINLYDWYDSYFESGKKALAEYLGSPSELDYDEVNLILSSFKEGSDELWLKRMGRDEASLWYDRVDVRDKKILILEWTHGNSEYLKGINIPILLSSTPEETLSYRLKRGRDNGIDSPFTALVLSLEQKLLDRRSSSAAIILSGNGEIN